MMTDDQDTAYQYLDDCDLLQEALKERGYLLQGREHLASVSQRNSSKETFTEFSLVRAQALLFELSVIGENIETLINEINCYAETCSKPRLQVTCTKPN